MNLGILLLLGLLGISYGSEKCVDEDYRCSNWKSFCKSLSFVVLKCPKTCDRCNDDGGGKCGISTIPLSRVIPGQDAIHGAWPWHVLLKYAKKPICGGTLISPEWVLTAAHCVSMREQYPGGFTVTVGKHKISTRDETEVEHEVEKVISHCAFRRDMGYDIALIKLLVPVRMTEYVRTACLPDYYDHAAIGTECYITGWGEINKPGFIHDTLKQSSLKVVDHKICVNEYKNVSGLVVAERTLCAQNENTTRNSGCHGDSGGAFMCKSGDTGHWYIKGILSWGSPRCDKSKGSSVFTRVTKFKYWIQEKMKDD